MKHLLALLIAIAIFGTVSCSGVQLQRMPEEGSPDLELVKTKCTTCHGLPHPGRHTPREWDHYLTLMKKLMDERGVPITKDEMLTIQAYLHRHARS